MDIRNNNIIVEKNARFYSNEPVSSRIKNLWFVLHGYGQLAGEFIREFDFISTPDTLIVAPEGLSRFHIRDKIGASWMTREDRENEITDYLKYLNKIVTQLKKQFDLESAKTNLLGFSQGVHTSVRFFINCDFHFENLLLCSSDFPKDVDFMKLKQKFVRSKMFYLYGDEDRSISLKSFKESINLLEEKKIPFKVISFHGGHTIHSQSLKKFA